MDTPTPAPVAPVVPAAVAPTGVAAQPVAAPVRSRRGVTLPGWLAVLILIGVAGGFGYLGWRLLKPAPAIDLAQFEPNDTARRFPGRNNNPGMPRVIRPAPTPPPEGVSIESNGNGTARISTLSVRFLVSGAKPTVVATSPGRQGIAAPDLLAGRVRALAINDAARRTAAGVTDDQVAKLRTMLFRTLPPVNDAARARLLALWDTYRAAAPAARPAIEQQLLTALREIAAAHNVADIAAYHATADQIRGVLSAEQIEKLSRPPRR